MPRRTQISPDDGNRRRWSKSTPAVAGLCEFKRFIPADQWTFHYTLGASRRMIGPAYGDAPRNQPIKRCPRCNRRLKLKAGFCIGGEFVRWEIPDHKPRETRKPGPRRQPRRASRGK